MGRLFYRHAVPCRPLPIWLRVPRAVCAAMLLIACVVVLFVVAPWFELGGPR